MEHTTPSDPAALPRYLRLLLSICRAMRIERGLTIGRKRRRRRARGRARAQR